MNAKNICLRLHFGVNLGRKLGFFNYLMRTSAGQEKNIRKIIIKLYKFLMEFLVCEERRWFYRVSESIGWGMEPTFCNWMKQ